MKYSSLLSLAAAVSLASACSGSSANPSPANTAITTATMDAVVAAYCDKLGTCFGDVFTRTNLKDQANCRSRLGTEFSKSLTGAGVGITEAQGQACLSAAKGATCNKILDGGIAECQFKGTLADGAACTSDAQCSSATCFVDDKASCGKCGAAAAAGADCAAQKCAPGLFCTSTKKCVARGAEGGSCDAASAPCAIDLDCYQGKCQKPLPRDAACKAGDGGGPACDLLKGLYCKPTALPALDGTCVPYTLAAPGRPCGFSTNPVDFALCVDLSQCVGAEGVTKLGTCTAHLADGASCSTGKDLVECQFPAKCREGKCALLDPALCK